MGIERLPTPQQAIGDRNKYRAIRLSNGIEALLIEGKRKIFIPLGFRKAGRVYCGGARETRESRVTIG